MNPTILIIAMALFLGGCSQKLVYIMGEEKAKAVIEASMTGGRISMDGPFIYCSEPAIVGDPGVEVTTSACIGIIHGPDKEVVDPGE